MTLRIGAALLLSLTLAACAPVHGWRGPSGPAASAASLAADLDTLFSTPPFDTAIWSVRIERAVKGVLYERNPRTLVMPASNMKIVTLAVAAETLGWDYRFETRLVAEGEVRNGTLHGDLRVIGTGDPSVSAADFGPSPLFLDWARVLREAGITHVTGRVIGDDNAFDDETLGAGWAWDFLSAGYAAPVSALQYGEGVAVVRIRPGAREGDPAIVLLSPPGHGLDLRANVRTGAPTADARINIERPLAQTSVTVSGTVPANGRQLIRTVSVLNPTLFFVEGLRQALNAAGVRVEGPAVDIDDLESYTPPAQPRTVAVHASAPLSELAAYFMKVSQNLYGETFLKAIGRTAGKGSGSLSTGRAVMRTVLEKWGIPPGTYAISDGSGLSRYNEISAWLVTTILRQMYEDERHRGWFLAALPVAGHDGTLGSRMTDTALQRAVQAKTGTISNARALSGFLTAPSGERVIFSIIANNFLRPSSEVDAIAEKALLAVLEAVKAAALASPSVAADGAVAPALPVPPPVLMSAPPEAGTRGPVSARAASGLNLAEWSDAALAGVDRDVFALALRAADAAIARGEASSPTTLSVIDFSLPSTTERMWVYDLRSRALLFRELVSHGRNSGWNESTKFSNVPESNKSSLGLFRTAEGYFGKHGYSLRLDGLEPGFNDFARARAIVIHGAAYVNGATANAQGRLGRSLGCPAVRPEISRRLIDAIKEGGLLFAYAPRQDWLAASTYLN